MDRRQFLKTAAGGGALAASQTVFADQAKTATTRPLKLKYSVQPHWFKDLPTMEARLERIKAEGFRAVENNGFKRMTPDEQKRYADKLSELGLEHGIFVANRGVNEGAGLVDPNQRDAFLDEIRKSIEVAPIINTKFVTITSGNEIPGEPRGPQTARVIDTLRQAGDLLGKAGITGVVEPLTTIVSCPGSFLARSDEAYAIMKAVDNPHIKILFDIYHQQITEGNLIDNIRAYWDEIGYFQFADVPGRHEPGTGEINYRNVFKAIYDLQKKTGRDLFVGAELGPIKGTDTAGTLACFEAIRQADDFET